MPEPAQTSLDDGSCTPTQPVPEAEFPERQDDPQQAEELERQQDA